MKRGRGDGCSRGGRGGGGGRNVKPCHSGRDDGWQPPTHPGSASPAPQAPPGHSGSASSQALGKPPRPPSPGSSSPARPPSPAHLPPSSSPSPLHSASTPTGVGTPESASPSPSSSPSPLHSASTPTGVGTPESASPSPSSSRSDLSIQSEEGQGEGEGEWKHKGSPDVKDYILSDSSTQSKKKKKKKKKKEEEVASTKKDIKYTLQQFQQMPSSQPPPSPRLPSPAWRRPWQEEESADVTQVESPLLTKLKQQSPPTEKKQVEPTQPKDISSTMRDFLNGFVYKEGSNAYYPAYSKLLKGLGESDFKIEFGHVVLHDLGLAISICNMDESERYRTLLPSVKAFLIANSFSKDVVDKATLTFSGMPRKIERLESLLNRKRRHLVTAVKDIINVGQIVPAMGDLGKFLVEGVLIDLFIQHTEGLSWGGDIGLEDLVVVDNQHCRITKRPKYYPHKLEHEKACCADVKKFEALISPHLAVAVSELRETSKRNSSGTVESELEYPLYYPELRKELICVRTDAVLTNWFKEYIVNSPALRCPQALHDFVCNTNLTVHLDRSPLSPSMLHNLEVMLDSCFQDKKETSWRVLMKDSPSRVVSEIYTFEYPLKVRDDKEDKEGKAKGLSAKKELDNFNTGFGGIIKYTRHFLQHAHLIVATSSIMMTMVSIAKQLPRYLHLLMRSMLLMGLMKQPEVLTTETRLYQPAHALPFLGRQHGMDHSLTILLSTLGTSEYLLVHETILLWIQAYFN